MHPILFTIHGFSFYTHGLLAVLGIVAATGVLYFLAIKNKLQTTYLFDNMIYSVLFGIIGARLTYFLLYRSQFTSFREVFYLWEGGLVSYGGFVIGLLVLILLWKAQKEPVLKWLDLLAIAFPLGLFLGRIGNIFAGEYGGMPTASRLNLGGVVPVTLYEAVLVLLIYFLLFFLYVSRRKLKSGLLFSFFFILYGFGRLIIDIYRDESRALWLLSAGQLASIIFGLVGLILFTYIITHPEKGNRREPKTA